MLPTALNQVGAYTEFNDAVIDEDGKVVAVFFGKYAPALASYCTTFPEAVEATIALKKLDAEPSTTAPDTALAPVEEVKSESVPG